jgi:hypothetical protein
MQLKSILPFSFFFCIFFLVSCCTTKKNTLKQPQANITGIRFLGEYDVPYNFSFNNTTVGGLSGIDYDPMNNLYYLISDDRSTINPARYYAANLYTTEKGIDSVRFTSVTYLLQPGGKVYPNNRQDPYHVPDPEDICLNPSRKQLVWSSEGERIIKEKDTILSDPAVRIIDMKGRLVDSFSIPGNLHMHATEKGPRQNSVFEGICFADNYKTLFVSVEEPLYEDGPRADVMENNAFIRILKFETGSKKMIGQYAYKLDPVAHASIPENAFKINGVPDILAVTDEKLLVIERSYSTGRLANTIKVFIADLTGATDIKNIPSLKENNNFKAMAKKLLVNMDDLGIYTDNIEGVTFGPVLKNGHKTLLFISDNNFNPLEKTQLLLFEVIE